MNVLTIPVLPRLKLIIRIVSGT